MAKKYRSEGDEEAIKIRAEADKEKRTMITLADIQKGKQAKPPRMILYAPQGFGKTTFGSRMPGAILLPSEDGANELDVPKYPLAKTKSQPLAFKRSL